MWYGSSCSCVGEKLTRNVFLPLSVLKSICLYDRGSLTVKYHPPFSFINIGQRGTVLHGDNVMFIAEHRLYSNELHKLNDINSDYEEHANYCKVK